MNVSWGVMDVLSSTDFPDIRFKSIIQSADDGSIVLIPREGGYLARFYIELDANRDQELLENRLVTPEKLTEVANRILSPYTLDIRSVGWWSVYEIGQRLCDKFDDVPADEVESRIPRVFIAGDACHTHSAKAGQGMNVSMADGFNLGWKLASVLRGVSRPELLHTYSQERQGIAKELIDFDHEWSKMLSSPPKRSDDAHGAGVDPEEFRRFWIRSGRYTAGVATRYQPSLITVSTSSDALAKGFPVGMRFHSAPVVRIADGKPIHLGHVAQADGRWRLYIFADRGDPRTLSSKARGLCERLEPEIAALTSRLLPAGDPDSLVDIRAIFQQSHHELDIMSVPSVLRPRKGRFGLVDYEKAYVPDPDAQDIFELRAINRDVGCMVLVRPDQFVAAIFGLEEHEHLLEFISSVFTEVRAPN